MLSNGENYDHRRQYCKRLVVEKVIIRMAPDFGHKDKSMDAQREEVESKQETQDFPTDCLLEWCCTGSLSIYELGHEKMCLMSYVNKNGADQPAHPRSLISAFVVCCLEKYIYRFYSRNFKTLASFCGCAGRFVSGLVGNSRRYILSWWGSYVFVLFNTWLRISKKYYVFLYVIMS